MATATARKGYRIDLPTPKDEQVTRNRWTRMLSFILFSALVVGGPTALATWWGSVVGHPLIGGLAGFWIGGFIASRLIPDRFLVNNPEWTAYVTQSMFGGEMVVYGPGLHLSHWWEERNKTGNYPLKLVKKSFSQSVATATSKAIVDGQFEYAVDLPHADRAVGVSESTVEAGASSLIENFLTSQCSKKDTEWVRTHIDELNELLSDDFEDTTVKGLSPESFRKKYGFLIVSIVITKISFTDAVQKTRDAADESLNTLKIVARLYGYGEDVAALEKDVRSGVIKPDAYTEMLEHAQAESENVKMDVQVFRGNVPSLPGQLAKGGRKP